MYIHIVCISPLYNIKLDVFHFVQEKVRGAVGVEGIIQLWKKTAEEYEDKVKKNEEVVKKLEKKREHYEGELVLVNSMPYKLTWIHWPWDSNLCPYVTRCCLVGVAIQCTLC